MSTSTKLSASQKGLAPILIVILIAALVGGYLLYQKQTRSVITPQPTIQPSSSPVASASAETTNWKIYEDAASGYSFKYPSNWDFGTSYSAGYLEESIVATADTKTAEWKAVNSSIRFFKTGDEHIFTNNMSKGNEQLIISVRNNLTFDNLKKKLNLDIPPTIINGKKSLKYATGAYILLHDNQDKILSFSRLQYPDEGFLDLILSTIKFSINLSQGQMYICPEDGIEYCIAPLSQKAQKQCTKEAVTWKKNNCSYFKDATYYAD